MVPLIRTVLGAFRRLRRTPDETPGTAPAGTPGGTGIPAGLVAAQRVGSHLIASGATHQGSVRVNNEDALLIDPRAGLLIVADGMGGHSAGEVASRMAVDVIQQALRGPDRGGLSHEPFDTGLAPSDRAASVADAVKLANRQVFRAGCADGACTGMGTTVALALVDGRVVTYCSVGDSRAYLYRGGALTQLTVDDSWVQAMREASPQAFDAAAHGSMRHVLTKVVGAAPEIDCTVAACELRGGDALLLCTDGLHGLVSDDEIRACFADCQSPEGVASALLDRALDAGGLDNVTVLVAQCTG